jgi:hypothetical protein
MGVLYAVIPLDPSLAAEIRRCYGVACAAGEQPSRFPSARELLNVLDSLTGYTTDYHVSQVNWQATVSSIDGTAGGAWCAINIRGYRGNEDEPAEFYFAKGWECVILLICERLSRVCGPLAVFPDTGDVPICVSPGLDLAAAAEAWA